MMRLGNRRMMEMSLNREINGNFTQTGKTNSSIGNFTIGQYNASCSGFRFGSAGGWILSCT